MGKQRYDLAAYLFIILYGVAAALVSIHRFWQYELFYDSFGLFDSVIWQFSRFQMPVIDHFAMGRLPVFADHLYPTLALLAPMYWITSRSETLLIAQVLTVALSGLVLYHTAKKITGQGWISFGIMCAYLLFVGMQNALITDVHEIVFATLPLMLTFWAIATNRKKLFYLFLILTLGCKETVAFTGIGIGIFMLWFPSWRKHGWYTIALSILWWYIASHVIIPYFSDGIYFYTPKLPREPLAWITGLVDVPEKQKTIWYSFQSFLFLPLFVPQLWPLILGDFITRFLPAGSGNHWTLGMHYNALTAVYLAIASAYGAKQALMIRRTKKVLLLLLPVLLLLNILFLHQRVLHGPLGLSYNPAFYRHTKNFGFLDAMVRQVPPDVSVMTQSNLAARFGHQPVYLLDINYDRFRPQYIILDLRDGQNPNNFFGMHGESLPMLLNTLAADPMYEVIYQTADQKMYKKK